MPEEDEDHRAHDHELVAQRSAERVDRAGNQRRAVVRRDDLDAGRQGDLREAPLDAGDHVERVGPEPHDDHAAHRFPLAVEVDEPAAQLGPEVYPGDVAETDRRAGAVGAHGHAAEIVDRLDVAAPAHHVLGAAELEEASAHLVVRAADRVDHVAQRQVVGEQRRRVDLDLVLLDEAAHRGDLGHPRHAGERVAQRPVLQRAQLGERVPPAAVDERVLVDPADAGGVGPELGGHPRGQPAADALEVLEHAAAGPVEVGAVLEDDVDEGVAEHRLAAHVLDARCGDHRGDDRVGDLVFHCVGAPSRPIGEHDHLHVGEVGERVERARAQRPHAGGGRKGDQQEHEEAVAGAPGDQPGDHRPPSLARTVNRSRAGGWPARSISTTTLHGPAIVKRTVAS